MPDLVVVVPSRGRPKAVAELAEQCAKTCTADTVLLVVVDSDDPTLPEYQAPAGTQVFFTWAPANSGHVGAINHGAAQALEQFAPFAIAKLDDDHRPRTSGWDALLLDILHDAGGGIAYGNDLLQGQRLPTAPVITADITKALGWMGPPQLRHLYVDDFWRDLGEQADCLHYLPSVIVEHMHPLAGKAPMDAGYRRANATEQYTADSAAYEAYKRNDLARDVAKVKTLRAV
jgi:glycosyltransferase involved in cell wall biosynthesis